MRANRLAVPADPRTDDITGDIAANGQVRAEWGLHLIDVNLFIGNLLDLAGPQTTAWLGQAPRKP